MKRRMKSNGESRGEFRGMTFIKVRRQLTGGGETGRGMATRRKQRGTFKLNHRQPRNLIQYKSPGIKLFRLMARQTNVVETQATAI